MNATRLGRLAVTSLAFAVLVLVPRLAAADDVADCAKETGEDAIAACTRRIESGEVKAHELAVMLDHRGLAVRRKGDIDRAIADFDEAIRLDPNFAEPVFRRAMVWAYNRSNVERAVTDLDHAIVLDPGFANAFFQRGLLHARQGDADHAIADFEAAIRLDPNNADALFQRGRVYGDKKRDYDRAIADFTEAFRRNPKFAAAINNRGFEYMLKGDLDHALADHSEAIRVYQPRTEGAARFCAAFWRDASAVEMSPSRNVISPYQK
jgi:tetratricopeptide (TPR) repeat protein